MNKSVYEKRVEAYRKWTNLKYNMSEPLLTFEKFMELKEQEDEAYKKWLFYDKYIKISNRIKFNDGKKESEE